MLCCVVLHQALLSREDSDGRGVTLIGFSIGARVIFSCLKELARLRSSSTSSGLAGVEVEAETMPLPMTAAAETDRRVDARKEPVDGDDKSFDKHEQAKDDKEEEEEEEEENDFDESENSDQAHTPTFDDTDKDLTDVLQQEVSEERRRKIDVLIQDVVLLGAPVAAKVRVDIAISIDSMFLVTYLMQSRCWRKVRGVVRGRLVNGYSRNDLVLGVLYRYGG